MHNMYVRITCWRNRISKSQPIDFYGLQYFLHLMHAEMYLVPVEYQVPGSITSLHGADKTKKQFLINEPGEMLSKSILWSIFFSDKQSEKGSKFLVSKIKILNLMPNFLFESRLIMIVVAGLACYARNYRQTTKFKHQNNPSILECWDNQIEGRHVIWYCSIRNRSH